MGIRQGLGVLKDPKILLCDFFDGFVWLSLYNCNWFTFPGVMKGVSTSKIYQSDWWSLKLFTFKTHRVNFLLYTWNCKVWWHEYGENKQSSLPTSLLNMFKGTTGRLTGLTYHASYWPLSLYPSVSFKESDCQMWITTTCSHRFLIGLL